MTTTHEFDAHCDQQDFAEPDYHEQVAVLWEMEENHEESLREQGAINALERLRNRLVFFRDAYETHYQNDASTSNYSAMLAHQLSVQTLDCELETHKQWLQLAKGGVL
jgi:hypothetical protein